MALSMSVRADRPDDDCVDLGAQSPENGQGRDPHPFLPLASPAIEPSINCVDCGDVAASASKTLNQTPAFAHRLKRLQTVVYGP